MAVGEQPENVLGIPFEEKIDDAEQVEGCTGDDLGPTTPGRPTLTEFASPPTTHNQPSNTTGTTGTGEVTVGGKGDDEWERKIGAVVDKINGVLVHVTPAVNKMLRACERAQVAVQPYNIQQFVPGSVGVILAFFGGQFSTTIAAAEAYRSSGTKSFRTIYDLIRLSNKEDKERQHIYTRNDQHFLIPFFRSCNPECLSSLLCDLYIGAITVFAALNIQVVKAMVLGSQLGDLVAKIVISRFQLQLEKVLSERGVSNVQKWSTLVLSYACKFSGVVMALVFKKYLSSLHSAVIGGALVSKEIIAFLLKKNYLKSPVKEHDSFSLATGCAISAVGLMFQMHTARNGLALPFKLLFAPASLFESVLKYTLANRGLFSAPITAAVAVSTVTSA